MFSSKLNKANALLLLGFALLTILYFGAGFLVPVTFAGFLAALMQPVNSTLEKKGVAPLLASFLSTLFVFITVGGLLWLLLYQLKVFTDDLPRIKEELGQLFIRIQYKLSGITGLDPQEQEALISSKSGELLQVMEEQLTLVLGNALAASLKFLLVLVYLFLFLLYRKKLAGFLLLYLPDRKEGKARTLLSKTSKVAHHYLWGRIKVMSILAAMYIITFLLFDIRYALLLTLFGALITIIPYIGPFISGSLPIFLIIVFGRSFSEVLLFAGIISVIQLIESYVLEPVIIGSEVQLNPLAVIIAVVIGGLLWGIAGMILFVPLFSMLKIIADHHASLRPLGYLLGNAKEFRG